jgi:hypothetical protein
MRGGRVDAASGHLERGADPVRRHKPELARGRRIAAAGDEHGREAG